MIPHKPLLLAGCIVASATARALAGPADVEFFEQKIRPVLVEKCFDCHSVEAKNLKGNLLLDSREGLLKGGDEALAAKMKRNPQAMMKSLQGAMDPNMLKNLGGAGGLMEMMKGLSGGAGMEGMKKMAKSMGFG